MSLPAVPLPEEPGGQHWRRTTYVVSATQVVVLVGFGLALPFTPLYLQELGVTDRGELALWTGLIAGAAGLPMAFLAPIWGAIGDRYGRKAMLLRAITGACVVLVGMGFASDARQVLALRLIQGALTGTGAAAATLVATVAPRERTGFALGLVNTAIQSGNFIGPLVGGIAIVAIGFRGSFFASAALMAGSVLATAVWVSEPLPARVRAARRRSAREFAAATVRVFAPVTWPELRGIIVVQLATQLIYASSLALLPLYVQDLAHPSWLTTELLIGLALAAGAIAAAASTPVLGILADRRGGRPVLIGGIVLLGLALAPHALLPATGVFLGLRLMLGVAVAAVTAAAGVLTRHAARPGGEGRAFGATMGANMLGWGIGPVVGSAVAAAFGLPTLFALGAVASAALLVPVFALWRWFEPRSTIARLGSVRRG